nr:DUF927 domain-containing protein [Acetobacter persici]
MASCDALLPMDEIGQLDPKEIGDVAYMLANGQGKVRASRTGGARVTARWRVLFLSTGEKTLDDLNKESGKGTKAGQEVRFLDMPADAGAGMGLFEETHHCDTPGEFADYLANACGQFYGAPFRAFMEHLADRMAAEGVMGFREALLARMDTIATSYLQNWPKASAGALCCATLCMIALAGELATEFNLTGWDRDTPEVLVGLCFADWLRLRGTAGRREDEQAIQKLRDFISRNASARFEDWIDKSAEEQPQSGENGEPPKERYRTMNRAGWRRWVKAPDGRYVWLYLLTSDGMNEALNGVSARDAKQMLVDRGLLIKAKDGKFSELLRPPGQGQVRLYQVHHDILAVATGDR